MPPSGTTDLRLHRVSELIAESLGLHFPPERTADLERGLAAAAKEFGLASAGECADWLLSATLSRPQLHELASHLTVGETYFFRERRVFEALAKQVLPELIQRRGASKRLRLWSAACCTGEEAYSLAILLRQCMPDWRDWNVSILASDVNERSLMKAAAAVYGEWSFREASPEFKESYFKRLPDGRYALEPQLKQWIKFAPLNLAADSFPSFATETVAMDLIFCRNVLMYFTPEQAQKVISNLHRALRDDGWLVVGSSDGSQALSRAFTPVSVMGAILHRKTDAHERPASPTTAPWIASSAVEPTPLPPPALEVSLEAPPPIETEACSTATHSQRARTLADEGKLDEALSWCDQWIAEDASDPAARYLRAVVLQELGNSMEARQSLQHALYLDPQLVLAHFALGNLARVDGQHVDARRHFNDTLALLRKCTPDEPLPESDGLTASRLAEILTALLALEAAA